MSNPPQKESVPDIIAHNLHILFCGINPGLTSAATNHHFARPGNRFWKALFLSSLTPVQLQPSQQHLLLQYQIGVTNFVSRPSATAKEVSNDEIVAGTEKLLNCITVHSPKNLVILGLDAYKKGFGKKEVKVGLQQEKIGSTAVWVLPNPSGLNAHYSLDDFAKLFTLIKKSINH